MVTTARKITRKEASDEAVKYFVSVGLEVDKNLEENGVYDRIREEYRKHPHPAKIDKYGNIVGCCVDP